VKRRILTTALAASIAVAGLAGCQSNVGVAARVGGSTISESDVSQYLTGSGVDAQLAQQAQSQGQKISPRSQVLSILVQQRVFEKTLEHLNLKPTEGALAAQHDASASLLLQTQLSGSALDKALDQQLPKSGIKKIFRQTFLRTQELEYTLISKRRLTQMAELLKLVKQAGLKVSVSPRYGSWDANSLTLTNEPVLPSFLVVQPRTGSAAQGG
jgi:hypothetical protein